jgi:hypothetical protein
VRRPPPRPGDLGEQALNDWGIEIEDKRSSTVI